MMKDIDEPVNAKIKELQNQVVEARKRQVNQMINSKLLEAEAKKRGISADRILEMEVVSKVKEPTEAEVQAFYQQNRDKIQGEFKDVKASIIAYMRNERQAQEAKQLADRLRTATPVKVMVENPTPPQTAAERARVFATVNGVAYHIRRCRRRAATDHLRVSRASLHPAQAVARCEDERYAFRCGSEKAKYDSESRLRCRSHS